MMFSSAILLILPVVVSSQWAPWPGTASTTTATEPAVASAQIMTSQYVQPQQQYGVQQQQYVQQPQYVQQQPQYGQQQQVVGALNYPSFAGEPIVAKAALDPSQFNLGTGGLCGKGPDGCNPIGPAPGIIPAPTPRIFGPAPPIVPPIFNPSPGPDDCDASGKSGKSKGYNGNNPNCCGNGGKSKGYSGGECGGKSGKGGRSRGRTSVSYEALASDATTVYSQTFYYVAVGTTLTALIATTLMM